MSKRLQSLSLKDFLLLSFNLCRDGGAYEDAYMITNAVLKGLQVYIENLFGKISIEN
jgi:hypothetical protein